MRLTSSWARTALRFVCILVLFAGGVGLSRMYDLEFAVHRTASASDARYTPSYERESGPQLVMAYLGSASCQWSNHASLPSAVEEIKLHLARHSRDRGLSFKAVGVALDWSTRRGLEHLSSFGLFDEVSAGYNWGNTLGLRYLWTDGAVRPETPQIIVYERRFIAPKEPGDPLHYGEADRRNLLSKVGLREITEWAGSGAPLFKSMGGENM